MVVENITIIPEELVNNLVFLTRFFQAIGGLIAAYIIFGIINYIIEHKKKNELTKMRLLLEEIKKILKNKK